MHGTGTPVKLSVMAPHFIFDEGGQTADGPQSFAL
jgi:hypothetical protein